MNHTNLARKMIKRGDDVVANTRMEFLFAMFPLQHASQTRQRTMNTLEKIRPWKT